MKIRLSMVKQVSVTKLKPNKRNSGYFRQESGQYFNRLQEDIKKRGIQVPLIVKADGTLLAGHNRLLVAKALGIKEVPVQRVLGKLTRDQEDEYIIKDNLLRRHMTPQERDALYRRIVPDFEERVMVKGAKGVAVDVKEIADKTGLNPQTIGFDLARNRREIAKEAREETKHDSLNEREVDIFKRAISRMLNIAIVEKGTTAKEFVRLVELEKERLVSL